MRNSPGAWCGEVRDRGVVAVGLALGLERGTRGLGPCPSCGARTRYPSRHDRRGAIGVRPDGLGWVCFECRAEGDAVTLAALLVPGMASPGRGHWATVRRACAQRGLCEADDGLPPTGVRRIEPPSRLVPATPNRPPADEVAALWAACRPVVTDIEVSAWLKGRGLNPAVVEDFQLARALPSNGSLPGWAYFMGRPWNETTHRLLVRMLSPIGHLESFHARALAPAIPHNKAASPAGVEVRGLVMADALGRLMLSGEQLGDGTPAANFVGRVGLWVAEWVPDFLTLATNWSDADQSAPAVFGVISGSWTKTLAAQVPDDCQVVIATDSDPGGEEYAERIVGTLVERVFSGSLPPLRRWRANSGRQA